MKQFYYYFYFVFANEEISVAFQRGEAGNHRAQAFAERSNRTHLEKLFLTNMLKK